MIEFLTLSAAVFAATVLGAAAAIAVGALGAAMVRFVMSRTTMGEDVCRMVSEMSGFALGVIAAVSLLASAVHIWGSA